ncbi:aromatic ring-hydroxylating oxygenase subunit alpha [Parablastomonas sp. CN1-191]|uniref:aromatic ring-hydroxylating oxygenase subunit alpha n=1 Tax=Parablastomonas sp. CN1-191 TaxID=3400908 RepID=UPI003BF8DF2E
MTEQALAVPASIEDMVDDLRQGLLPAAVFHDRDVYDLELRRIFAKSWVYIGHETEIPERGDFVTRNIGEDPFILIRDDKDELRVLLNACRHRGAQVCRVQAGNTKGFVCPFHGWAYRNSGELIGVPVRAQGYGALDLKEWGLFAAPHVVNYMGLIFANLDPDAVPFEEYLGDYKWYFDIQFALSEGGMEVLGEPHRWLVDANWKQGAENFCGDSSHTQMTHRSVLDAGIIESAAAGAPKEGTGLHIHDCSGHAISIRQLPGEAPFISYPEEVTRHFHPGVLNQDQFDLAKRSLLQNGTLFPNFSFLHIGLSDSPEKPQAGFLTLRVWQPKGPGQMEIWNWVLAPKEASADYKRRAYQVGMSSFSPSGSFEQDDVAVWPGVTRTAGTVFAELNKVRFNYQMGLGDMSSSKPLTDWVGPGVANSTNAGEGGLRTFHKTWYERITNTTVEIGDHD